MSAPIGKAPKAKSEIPTAKARKGKARAVVDTSTQVANSEVHCVFRLRKEKPPEAAGEAAKETGGAPVKVKEAAREPVPYPDSEEEGPERTGPKQKKRKSLSGKAFLDEKRKIKARKREMQGAYKAEPMDEKKYVHVKVSCDPMGILNALLEENFAGAESIDVAPRMQCAWLVYGSKDAAEAQIQKEEVMIAGEPVKVCQGKKAAEEVFVSFAGRKLLGAFLNQHLPGVKDVVEATDNALRARFTSKEAAKAAVKQGVIKAIQNCTLCAVGTGMAL
uniref:Uncharacterized protein n=1 Tax=Eutreptiella gymnastica TaxID=73025 RepID=A0A7S1HUR6_9EUGL|mmetsp:Transcript_107261/g.185051  ORF Transcript_107261/g.185051 Transcript_107261/m.185051 type:complete len:276 (+) Transcript_107261:38-865(+)